MPVYSPPYFVCASLSTSRWFCGHWAWGFRKPLNSAWSELWQGADRRHPGAPPGARQGLLHLCDRKLPAQLLWHLHPFIVSNEGAHPGHAAKNPPWTGECSHVQRRDSVLEIPLLHSGLPHRSQHSSYFIVLQIWSITLLGPSRLNCFSVLCLFSTVWRWECNKHWKASRHS